MTTPFLIADAAEVAIMSPLAEAAFGSYDLRVPEGIDIEDVHEFEAPGNELGYVARLSPQRATGIARRFIRADVAVTAKDDTDPDVIPESDVDRVLSEAESRVESEFFLESDITKAGLGAWVPYVDFNVGDIVNVRIFDIWVKLPVTRIEPIISEGDVVDWRVHVGGQLLSDDQAREVENATIQKELIQDRRDLAGIDAKATKAVKDSSDAKDTAGQAKQVAQTANSAASQAQTSADGKSTVFYGATTPAKAKAGDTWFKDLAGGGTALMQYVNGKWVEKVNAKAIDDELAANQEAITELNDVALPGLKAELEALDTVVAREAADKLATLEKKLAAADTALKQDLQAELAELDEALTGDLATSLTNLKAELEALDTVIAQEAAAKLATLETKLADADKALKEDLQGELAALDEALSGDLTSKLAGLKGELEALDTEVAREAAANLATLEKKLANADKALKQGLQGELAELDEELSGELTSSLTSLKEDLEAADAAGAEAVATTLVQLENRLKAADKALKTDLVAQLGELEADLAALDTAVGENLTAKLEALRTELQQADATVRTTLRGELSTLKTQLQNADATLKTDLVGQLNAARKALEDADKDINTNLSKRLEDARKDLKAASDTIAKDLAGVDMLVENQRPGNLFPDPFFKHSLWGSRYNAEEECLEITANGTTTGIYYFPDGYNVFSHLMTLEPGASYLLTIDARFSGNEVVEHATVYCRYCDVAGDWKGAALGRIDRTNEVNYKWGTTSLVLTMPDNVSSEATLGFYISSAYASGNVRLRNVRLHRAADNSLIIDGSVTAAKVKAGVIDADHIAAGAIVATKLAADSVVAGKIASNAVVAENIKAGQVTTAKLAADAVTANKIAADQILAEHIKAGQITTKKLAADAVTANEIAADAVTANAIKAGEVAAKHLAADAVTANKVAADAILARNIKAGQITTAKIAADAVTANEIASNQILAKHIKSEQITTAKIKADAVTAKELAADAVSATKLLAEDATIDKLWANGIAAKSIVTNRILVAGNGNMLPEVATYAYADSRPDPDPYPRPFGLNTSDPSVWVQAQSSATIHHPVELVAGQKYRFSYGVHASVNGTKHYWQLRKGNADGYAAGSVNVKKGSTHTSYVIRNEVANRAITSYEVEFEALTTETVYFYLYPNHTNGTTNDDGYQWFRDLRLEKMTGATLIEDGAITTNKIAANAVTANAIEADAVTANAIKAGEVAAKHLAADAVTANKVAADAILARNIKAGQITTAKIAADAVTANEIASNQILAKHIKAGQITTAKIAADAVTANEIASNQILAKHIKANQITTAKIATDAVTANEIAANAVTANAIKAGEVTAGKIASKAVTANEIASETILATNIKANQITTAKIAANAVTANEIKADQVLSKHVKSDQILAKHVKSGEIKAGHLLAEDATINKLWTNGIAAKSIVSNRILVAGNGNMLPEIATYAGTSTRPEIDPYPRPFGVNSGHPSVWLTGRSTAIINHPLNLVAGQKYRFSYRVNASVNGTRHFWHLRDGNAESYSGTSVSVKVGNGTSSYIINNEVANTSIIDYAVEFEAITTGTYYLLVYPNHTNGTDNDGGCQWFRDLRLEKLTGATLIEDGAVTTDKIAADAVTANSIKSGQITSDHISSAKISSDKITVKNGFIKNAMIDNGEITNAKIANLDAGKITTGTINANRIGAKTITGSHLSVDTIEADRIKANVFTQVANSVLPLIPGTVTPTWTDGLKYVPRSGTKDAELPAGIPGYYRHPSGTIAAGTSTSVTNTYNNVVSIDPNLEYEATWWVRSSSGSPRYMYVTLQDQNGNTDIVQKVEGVDDDGNNLSKHTWGNPIRVIITSASTTWTKYSTLFTFKEGTKSVRVNNVHFNNGGNSNAAYLYIAGLEISPHIIPQREIDTRQDQAIDKIQEYVDQMMGTFYSQSAAYAKKFNELSEPQSGGLVAGQDEPGIMTTTTSKITCTPGWVGHILVQYTDPNAGGHEKPGVVADRHDVTASNREFSIPTSYNIWGTAAIHWFKRPGRAYVADMSTGAQSATYNTWKTLSTTSVGTGDWNLTATVGWDAATNHNKYGIRILVNGSEVARVAPRTGLGPLLPIGDGYRTQSVSASGDGNGRTTKFEIQAYTDATTSASGPRRIRRVNATLDWTKIN